MSEKSAARHTPTPWRLSYVNDDGSFEIINEDGPKAFVIGHRNPFTHRAAESKANAQFIVTAVNEHDALKAQVAELKAALEQFCAWLEDGILVRDITKDAQPDWGIKMMHFVNDLNKAKAALEKTK